MESDRPRVLVVEDHRTTRRFLADNLTADGFELFEAPSLADAARLLRSELPDLVILDLGLPDGDGLELMRKLRREGRWGERTDADVPVLALTGRAGELDRLRGFEAGCDDYLGKPFSYPELLARLRALLRRSRRRHVRSRLCIGSLQLDPLARQVWLSGERVALSRKEFALLLALASDPTRVFTREELLRGVWGFRSICPTRTVDSHAYRLRTKLCRGDERYVINVWGVGYRLIDGPVEP